MRKEDATAAVYMDCLNEEAISKYFANLKECLQENKLMDSPGEIYNVDESSMPLDRCPPKVVGKGGNERSEAA